MKSTIEFLEFKKDKNMETIKVSIENNPNVSMTIPLNQIDGFEVSHGLSKFHYGHLRGHVDNYSFILKVRLYGSNTIDIPVSCEDFNRVKRTMNG